jgi:hypothetical protein
MNCNKLTKWFALHLHYLPSVTEYHIHPLYHTRIQHYNHFQVYNVQWSYNVQGWLTLHSHIFCLSSPFKWTPSKRFYAEILYDFVSRICATWGGGGLSIDTTKLMTVWSEYTSQDPSLCNLFHSPLSSKVSDYNISLKYMKSEVLIAVKMLVITPKTIEHHNSDDNNR